jgi:uncharacterized FlgJ-related protein
MKLYYLDKKTLSYNNVKLINIINKITKIPLILLIILLFVNSNTSQTKILYENSNEKAYIIIEDEFTKEKLISEIKRLNIKFPYIVLAQSILETNYWSSNIFYQNNNLFGLKEAKIRITTARKTINNHAYYDNWRESLFDYCLYQTAYLSKIKKEDDYYLYIGSYYAEDPLYVSSLKYIIDNNNLKQYFE